MATASSEQHELVRQQKQQLRKEIREKMRSLSEEDLNQQSEMVWKRVIAMPDYQNAKSIGVFLSMPNSEIRTRSIIQHASQENKVIYVPEVGSNFELTNMELIKVPPASTGVVAGPSSALFFDGWPKNKWGIPEPPSDMHRHNAAPGDLDLIIVPGLAFDSAGNRLGQGKGYYDRFLARMTTTNAGGVRSPFLIGVGLTCQKVDSIPVDEHDHRLDAVVFPLEAFVLTSSKETKT